MKVKIQGMHWLIDVTSIVPYSNAGTAEVAEESTVVAIADVGGALDGLYFKIWSVNGEFWVWFNVDAGGNQPTLPANTTAIPVTVTTGMTAQQVSDAIVAAIDAHADFSASNSASTTTTIVNATAGAVTDINAGTSGMAVATTVQGVTLIPAVDATIGMVKVVGTYTYSQSKFGVGASGNTSLNEVPITKAITVITHATRVENIFE